MSGRGLCFLTVAEQGRLIREREVSPVEVTTSVLRQIDRVDGKVNSYITVMGDAALSAANEAEREIAAGDYRGPLHGIPVAVKDLFYTRGVRTTAGSRILRDFVPEEDATVVSRLRDAGAIIVGKTGMHEFAYGCTNVNPHFGNVLNPWDLNRVPGGSSGGSAAAVAARMGSAALGSDTGGSIRIPSSLCGLVGLKPTYGRVSRHGAIVGAWSMDHVGPMCRTAEDAALVLQAIAGRDPKDPASSGEPVPDYAAQLSGEVAGLRLAVIREYATDPTDPEVAAAFQAALDLLRGMGARVEEISIPETRYAIGASTAIMASEITSYHEQYLRERPEDYGEDLRLRLESGLLIAATDYVKALRVRRLVTDRLLESLGEYDALLCPTEPTTAPRIDQEIVQFPGCEEARVPALVRHTRLFNLTGLPALTVPCGFASNGLPMGLEIAGAPFAEGKLLRIAHAYQQGTDWHLRVPPVALS